MDNQSPAHSRRYVRSRPTSRGPYGFPIHIQAAMSDDKWISAQVLDAAADRETRRWAAGYPPTIAHCLTPVAGRSADVRQDPSYGARSDWLRAGTRSRPGGPGRETSKGSAWI